MVRTSGFIHPRTTKIILICRHRLMVRTSGFHPENRGSIPRGGTNFLLFQCFIFVVRGRPENRGSIPLGTTITKK